MPKFGELLATDVWAAAARTLTDISAEEVFDLPEMPSAYAGALPVSAATVDTFGSWVEHTADVGAGKRLVVAAITMLHMADADCEVEIGEGESGSEVAITRVNVHVTKESSVGLRAWWVFYLWRALTDNARLSVRAKDGSGSALYYEVHLGVL